VYLVIGALSLCWGIYLLTPRGVASELRYNRRHPRSNFGPRPRTSTEVRLGGALLIALALLILVAGLDGFGFDGRSTGVGGVILVIAIVWAMARRLGYRGP
jgi:hypothetical protein